MFGRRLEVLESVYGPHRPRKDTRFPKRSSNNVSVPDKRSSRDRQLRPCQLESHDRYNPLSMAGEEYWTSWASEAMRCEHATTISRSTKRFECDDSGEPMAARWDLQRRMRDYTRCGVRKKFDEGESTIVCGCRDSRIHRTSVHEMEEKPKEEELGADRRLHLNNGNCKWRTK